MATRQGDWRDLLGAYWRALSAKKLWLGFVGLLGTVLIFWVAAEIYAYVAFRDALGVGGVLYLQRIGLADCQTPRELFVAVWARFFLGIMRGRPDVVLAHVAPLFNPLGSDLLHLLMSTVFYLALLRMWTFAGGVISRVTALEYGRDDLPTLRECTDMVRARRQAYFYTPVIPFIALAGCLIINFLVGLAGSVPHWGPWLLVPGFAVAALTSVLAVFFLVLGLLSFGLMMPVVSMSGADAFECWSASYSYALWGFGRLVVYRLVVGVIGLVAVAAAALVAQLFLVVLTTSVGLAMMGRATGMESYMKAIVGTDSTAVLAQGAPAWGVRAALAALSVVAFVARVLVLAYAASYYFTANTIIAFLLRKHVDRIDVDEVYVAEPAPAPAAEGGAAPASPAPEAAPAAPAPGCGRQEQP